MENSAWMKRHFAISIGERIPSGIAYNRRTRMRHARTHENWGRARARALASRGAAPEGARCVFVFELGNHVGVVHATRD